MKKLLCNVWMMLCIFSTTNLTKTMGQNVIDPNNAGCAGASAVGNCSAAIGNNAVAGTGTNANAYAVGKGANALASESVAIGRDVYTSNGTTGNIIIGTSGVANFINSISNSMMLGMTATYPTVFIGASSDPWPYGNVGIGNITAPASLLHVRDQIRVGRSGSDNGSLVFNNAASSTITFNTPASMTTQSYTLPTATGSTNDFLQLGASGQLQWASAGTVTGAWMLTGNSDATASSILGATTTGVPLRIHAGGAEHLRVEATGNVGIGTTAPAQRLHVSSSSGNTHLELQRPSGSAGYVRFSTTVNGGYIGMDNSDHMRYYNLTQNADHRFSVNLGGTQTDAMRIIGSSANVGIGTNSAGSRLHVQATASGNEQLARLTVGDAGNDHLRFFNRSSNNTEYAPIVQALSTTQTALPSLTIDAQTDPTGDTGTQPLMEFSARRNNDTEVDTRPLFRWSNRTAMKMQMDAAGNLGIGTANPSGRLHVNGTVFANLGTTGTAGNYLRLVGGEIVEFTSTANHKVGIEDISFDKEAFLSLRPVDFVWKEAYGGAADVGLIAEEVEQLMPNMVNYHFRHTYINQTTGEMLRDSIGNPVLDTTQMQPWGVDYHKMAVYLFALVKEHETVVNNLVDRLNAVESIVEGCCNTEPSYRIGSDENETLNMSSNYLRVFPNPNDGNFTIDYELPENVIGELYLITVSGQKMLLSNNVRSIGKEYFNISGPSGVYQVVLETGGGSVLNSVKVVVTK